MRIAWHAGMEIANSIFESIPLACAAIVILIKSLAVHETVMSNERLRAESIKILRGLRSVRRQEQVECILMGKKW